MIMMIQMSVGFIAGAMIMYYLGIQPPITTAQPMRPVQTEVVANLRSYSQEIGTRLEAAIEIIREDIKDLSPDCPAIAKAVETPITVREICINGIVYLHTNRGGLAARVNGGNERGFIDCDEDSINTNFSTKVIKGE